MSRQKSLSLSKSTLIRGLQCQKSLYLYKNFYDLRDKTDRVQQQRFDRGHRVGILAHQLFPGGKDVSPPSPFQYDQSVAATKALISTGCLAIYEPSFKYQGILVALDILVQKDGKLYAYEVKSSLRITRTYLQDAAIQYYVMTKSGLQIEDFFIVNVNGDYIKNGEIDLAQFFNIVSVKEEILEKQLFVEETIENAIHTISADTIPDIPIGKHCFKPYPCDFQGYCWKTLPEKSVFSMAGWGLEEKFELFEKGYILLKDVPEESITRERQKIQWKAIQSGDAIIDKVALQHFFGDVEFPLYFFDLEAFQPAIPLYDGTKPFQHLPFQFSLHYKASIEAPFEHTEFLAPGTEDPRKEFLDNFLEATERPGKIVVFNTLMESSIMGALEHLFPKEKDVIRERKKRFVDLETPFKNDWYYHPKMNGSYSLKSVMPVLAPGFGYEDLDIKDGMEAMAVFNEILYETNPEKIARSRKELLEYCRMDTLGLMKVFKGLKKLVEEQ